MSVVVGLDSARRQRGLDELCLAETGVVVPGRQNK